MPKMTFRQQNGCGYVRGGIPEQRAHPGLRRNDQQHRRTDPIQVVRTDARADDGFDMYRDVPKNRDRARTAPREKEKVPLWMLGLLFSAVGALCFFMDTVAFSQTFSGLSSYGVDIGISPISFIKNPNGDVAKQLSSFIPMKLTVAAPAVFALSAVLFAYFRDEMFDRFVLAVFISAAPGIMTAYVMKTVSDVTILGFRIFELGIGGYVMIACSAALVAVCLAERGVFDRVLQKRADCAYPR